LYNGVGEGDVCMIRFSGLRPKFIPSVLGLDSENAAHRIAVEWEIGGKKFEGVFIPKRNTATRFNFLTGGKVFPCIFQMSQFVVNEQNDNYQLEIFQENDQEPIVHFDGQVSTRFSEKSIFSNIEAASDFFAKGAYEKYAPRMA
jgi:hypothetical protein